jgi:hypothetical protein
MATGSTHHDSVEPALANRHHDRRLPICPAVDRYSSSRPTVHTVVGAHRAHRDPCGTGDGAGYLVAQELGRPVA